MMMIMSAGETRRIQWSDAARAFVRLATLPTTAVAVCTAVRPSPSLVGMSCDKWRERKQCGATTTGATIASSVHTQAIQRATASTQAFKRARAWRGHNCACTYFGPRHGQLPPWDMIASVVYEVLANLRVTM